MFDVAIIGGGCFGVSIAYNIGKLGRESNLKTSVILVEKTELTAGSTWHAAGLVTYFHPAINMKKVHYDSLNIYHELFEGNDEFKNTFHIPGSLRIATTALRWQEMHYQMNRYYACTTDLNWIDHRKVGQRLVGVDEIKAMCPIINTDNIIGGLYTGRDGHIDPNSLTTVMAQKAVNEFGALFKLNSPVLGISYDASEHLWNLQIPCSEKKSEINLSENNPTSRVLKARNVVNCAGLWAHEVNKLVGINDTPLVPINHQYLITESLPHKIQFNKNRLENGEMRTEIAVMRDLEGSYYLRQEKDALLVGPYESPSSMALKQDWIEKGVPQDFGKQLFEPDITRLTPHLEMAIKRFPILNQVGIKICVHGPIMYAPDVLPLVGPVREQPPGYWIAAGSGYGIVHAGGIGKYLAQWILNGEPPYDLIECDPDRFNPTRWADKKFVFAKSRETYGLNNAIYFPKEQRVAGRPTRRLTALAKHLAEHRGAVMGFNNGWEQPLYFIPSKLDKFICENDQGYSSYLNKALLTNTSIGKPYYGIPNINDSYNWYQRIREEVNKIKTGLGFIDLTPFGKFMVSGKDSNHFLDILVANSLPNVGRTKIAHMIAPASGKVYSEMTISKLSPNQYFLITGAGSELHDLRWLEFWRNSFGRKYDCIINNVTDDWGVLGIYGPFSHDFIGSLFGGDTSSTTIPSLTRKSHMDNSLNSSSSPLLKFMGNICAQIDVGGIKCSVMLIRITYTGEFGYELYYPLAQGLPIYLKCIEIAQKLSESLNFPITDFGSYSMASLRIEKGFRAWSHEMNMDRGMFEAELTPFLKLNKEVEFIGKQILTKLNGTFYGNPDNKVLRFLTVDRRLDNKDLIYSTLADNNFIYNDTAYPPNHMDLEGNESIWHDGKCIGYTTSGAYSFTIDKNIAYAFLPLNICQQFESKNEQTELHLNYMGNFYECTYHKEPLIKTAEMVEKESLQNTKKRDKKV